MPKTQILYRVGNKNYQLTKLSLTHRHLDIIDIQPTRIGLFYQKQKNTLYIPISISPDALKQCIITLYQKKPEFSLQDLEQAIEKPCFIELTLTQDFLYKKLAIDEILETGRFTQTTRKWELIIPKTLSYEDIDQRLQTLYSEHPEPNQTQILESLSQIYCNFELSTSCLCIELEKQVSTVSQLITSYRLPLNDTLEEKTLDTLLPKLFTTENLAPSIQKITQALGSKGFAYRLDHHQKTGIKQLWCRRTQSFTSNERFIITGDYAPITLPARLDEEVIASRLHVFFESNTSPSAQELRDYFPEQLPCAFKLSASSPIISQDSIMDRSNIDNRVLGRHPGFR